MGNNLPKNNTGEAKKGVQRKSIERVWELVEKSSEPLTPSNISKKLNLQTSTIKSCLEFLKNFGKVEIITNGRVMLVRKKVEVQNATIS